MGILNTLLPTATWNPTVAAAPVPNKSVAPPVVNKSVAPPVVNKSVAPVTTNMGIKAAAPTDNVKVASTVLPTQYQSSVQTNNPATGQYSAPLGSADRTNQLLAAASQQTGVAAPTFTSQANQSAPIQAPPPSNGGATIDANGQPYMINGQPTTKFLYDQYTQATNQGKPGYDVMGNPISGTAAPAAPPAPKPPDITPPGILNTLMGVSAGNQPIGANANAITQRYSDLIQPMLGEQVGQRTTGTYPVGEGNAAAIGQEIQGLAAQEGQELTGNAQGLTAQNQQQSGVISALSAAQNTTQLPYNTPVAYTNSGQPVPGSAQSGGASLQTSVQNALQQIKNGTGFTNALSSSGLDQFGLAGKTALLQALPQGFSPNQSDAQAATQAQNIQTSGTAVTNANAAAYAANLNPYLQLQTTVSNVDQFGNLLLNTMEQGGINPFDVKLSNTTLAAARNQLSSAQQAVFDNTYASLKSRVSGLLATGGAEIPTQITADANKILDGSLPVTSLSAVLSRIGAEGQILLTNQAQLVNKPLQTAGGSTSGQVGTPTSDYNAYLQAIGGQ